ASATATAAAMVGMWAMGPDPVHINGGLGSPEECEKVMDRLERIGAAIMNRSSASGPMTADPLASILADREKHRAAAQILGQAYAPAYAWLATNRRPLERIADTLVDRKEMHGDEVVELLGNVGLERPKIDLMDEKTWPTV